MLSLKLQATTRPLARQSQQRWVEILIDPRASSNTKAKKKAPQRTTHHRLVDCIGIVAQGGSGGKGSLSSQALNRKRRLVPDGGHGGSGGSVVIVADPQQQTLPLRQRHFRAEDGAPGLSNQRAGREGDNLIVRVPCGVVVKRLLREDEYWDEEHQQMRKTYWREDQFEEDPETEEDLVYPELVQRGHREEEGISSDNDEEYDDGEYTSSESDYDDEEAGESWFDVNSSGEEDDNRNETTMILEDLDKPGAHVVVARGGSGGHGSHTFASQHGPLPDAKTMMRHVTPKPGEVAYLELELKTIADIGLVGFPNAGKSSLLRAMSRASPEVAPYPFTTLNPIVGTIEYRDGKRIKAADIPGIIDGAAQGRGKGIDFLRHIERTKALLYVIDMAGTDYRDPIEDLRVLVEELDQYEGGFLLDRHSLVVANKVDLLSPRRACELVQSLQEESETVGLRMVGDVMPISAGVTGQGLADLSKKLREMVTLSEREARGGDSDDQTIGSSTC